MTAVAIAALAVLLYLGFALVNEALTFGVAIAVAVVALLMSVTGPRIGHSAPGLASYLMRAWTVVVLLGAGGVAAIVAHLGVTLVAEDPKGTDKVVAGLVVAVLVAVGEQASKFCEDHLASWWSHLTVCLRYKKDFQAQPATPGPGLEAYTSMTACVGDDSSSAWSAAATEERLTKLAAAYATGEQYGGPNFTPVPEPGPAE